MPGKTFTQEASASIQGILDRATANGSTGVPGLVFSAVDGQGNVLTEHVSGKRGLGFAASSQAPMTSDTVFAIYSCTKLITAIAAMQLVERGEAQLDDHDWLYAVAPELKAKKVWQLDGSYKDKTEEITLRKLLTHTAGFGYAFFDPRVAASNRPAGFNEFSGDIEDITLQPLVNQPGSAWEYGINMDWAGIVVERVSKLSLDEFFKTNIFGPLGITDMTFHPTQHMLDNLAAQHQRINGTTIERDVLLRRAVSGQKSGKIFNSGGAGCFAKPSDYCKILSTLLNEGTSPSTQNQILRKETVQEMFKNQIPQFPDFARGGITEGYNPILTNPSPEMYPQQGNPPQGWGLSFFITQEPTATGRGRNTAWWAGIANLFWWCDREKNVAGFLASQMLPFGDPTVLLVD